MTPTTVQKASSPLCIKTHHIFFGQFLSDHFLSLQTKYLHHHRGHLFTWAVWFCMYTQTLKWYVSYAYTAVQDSPTAINRTNFNKTVTGINVPPLLSLLLFSISWLITAADGPGGG